MERQTDWRSVHSSVLRTRLTLGRTRTSPLRRGRDEGVIVYGVEEREWVRSNVLRQKVSVWTVPYIPVPFLFVSFSLSLPLNLKGPRRLFQVKDDMIFFFFVGVSLTF